jgi:hypothetical protein
MMLAAEPPAAGVGIRSLAIISPETESTKPAASLVPPKSRPSTIFVGL